MIGVEWKQLGFHLFGGVIRAHMNIVHAKIPSDFFGSETAVVGI